MKLEKLHFHKQSLAYTSKGALNENLAQLTLGILSESAAQPEEEIKRLLNLQMKPESTPTTKKKANVIY